MNSTRKKYLLQNILFYGGDDEDSATLLVLQLEKNRLSMSSMLFNVFEMELLQYMQVNTYVYLLIISRENFAF